LHHVHCSRSLDNKFYFGPLCVRRLLVQLGGQWSLVTSHDTVYEQYMHAV
jgi:hypothetical protein